MTSTMLQVDETQISDDDYLGELDTAWQGCREAVKATQTEHRIRQAAVTARYRETLDRAWADYQRIVAGTFAPQRRERVAAARRAFNAAAVAASRAREVAFASAADEYLSGLERICSRYEGAVDVAVSAAASAIAGGLDEHPRGSLAAA
jgi:hypothetical protein